jgi:2-polyprenyl-3-methyl-5-hydroxy-6-metoxy-1,4-benzoquinol methylase
LKSEISSTVTKEVESVISAIDLDLDNKAWLSRILESRNQRGFTQVRDFTGKSDPEINYYVFEEQFRGSRESILSHHTSFIDYFVNCTNVLDIGCGRGEFLELARSRGINARGIDVNEDMINFCKSKGLNAELKDAIETLNEIEEKSLDGIFISQVVEHLSPDYLINMLSLCNRKMKHGFYIVIETVNPLSFFSFSNFYLDLSHVKPVHPETLKFLLNSAEFRNIETKFLSPVPPEMKLQKLPSSHDFSEKYGLMLEIYNRNIDVINNAIYGAQDYAVIGKK